MYTFLLHHSTKCKNINVLLEVRTFPLAMDNTIMRVNMRVHVYIVKNYLLLFLSLVLIHKKSFLTHSELDITLIKMYVCNFMSHIFTNSTIWIFKKIIFTRQIGNEDNYIQRKHAFNSKNTHMYFVNAYKIKKPACGFFSLLKCLTQHIY